MEVFTVCEIESFYPLKLLTPWTPEIKMTDHLSWCCATCGSKTESTVRGIKIRLGKSGQVCRNKNASAGAETAVSFLFKPVPLDHHVTQLDYVE